ncbi:MAG: four helix bundle protein [candidate division KSB1 bacterium]|nr:four helix bundle protein [candidate division KSB1 bacterium]
MPKGEKLDTRIRKASSSSTANITEGYRRFHYQEGIQFYRIARGSLHELRDHLISCQELQYVSRDFVDGTLDSPEYANVTLNGYSNSVRKRKREQCHRDIRGIGGTCVIFCSLSICSSPSFLYPLMF